MNDPTSKGGSPLTTSVERLRHELDRWLDVAMSQGERALDAFGIRPNAGPGQWAPAVDVYETNDEVHVFADLPGVPPQSVDVMLAGNMLTIRGEAPARPMVEGIMRHAAERRGGSFYRAIAMPASVDPEKVSAEVKLGVLEIHVGKTERAKARTIPVRTSDPPTAM